MADGVESGASSLLVIEDGEPFGGACFFFVGESDFVELPFIMFNHIVELERNIGDDEMIGQLESARRRNVKAIWPWLQEDFRVGQVAAGDVAGELAGRMYQIPVVSERQHRFFLRSDFHFAKSHCTGKVLLVQ